MRSQQFDLAGRFVRCISGSLASPSSSSAAQVSHTANFTLIPGSVSGFSRHSSPRFDLLSSAGFFTVSLAFASTALADQPQPPPLTPSSRASPSLTLQPAPADLVSNEHTAKWRIFTDRGRECAAQGNLAEAELFMRQALTEAREGFGPKDPHVAAALQNLGELLRLRNRMDEAEPLYLEALELLETTYGALHPAVGTALHNMAGLYVNRGNLASAETFYTRALKIRNDLLGKRHPESASTAYHLAEILRLRGKSAAALPYFAASLEYFREIAALSSPVAIRRLGRYLECLIEAKRWKEYETALRALTDFIEDARGSAHDPAAQVAEHLVGFLRARGRGAEAERLLETVLKARTEKYGSGHPLLARSLTMAAEAHLAARPDAQALTLSLTRLRLAAGFLRDALGAAAAHRPVAETPRAHYGATVESARLSLDLIRNLRLVAKAEEMRGGKAEVGIYSTSPAAEAALAEALRVARRARCEFDLTSLPAEIFGYKALGEKSTEKKRAAADASEQRAAIEPPTPSLMDILLRIIGLKGADENVEALRELRAPTVPTKREVQAGLGLGKALLGECSALVADLETRAAAAAGGKLKGGKTSAATEAAAELSKDREEIGRLATEVEANMAKLAV